MTYSQDTLDMCERHVAEGEAHIARQRALIDRLKIRGLPTGDALRFLHTLERMQEAHVAHRDLVSRDLSHGGPGYR